MNKTCLICKKTIENATCPYCGYEETTEYDPHHLLAGTYLSSGKYSVGNVVGAGGFGVTYSAWDHALDRHVAVKEYMPGEFSTRMPGNTFITVYGGEKAEQFASGMDKFLDESRKLAKFTETPGIVQIYDCFQENNTAYIVMEYLEGETLAERIDREGKIPVKEAVDIMIPVLDALDTVHAEGIIHRDIAPNNIFFTNDGKVKLLDFGAARSATGTHSKSLTVLYKEGYTAEEQYRSRGEQGTWTDVYAAAATLYKAITGITPEGAMERRLDDKLKAPSKTGIKIAGNVDTAIMNALNVSVKKRTQTAGQFRDELLNKKGVHRRYKRTKDKKTGRIPAAVFIISAMGMATVITLLVLLRNGVIEFHTETFSNLFLPDGKARVMNVVNMLPEEAEKRLKNIGLEMEIVGKIYDGPHTGRIVEQKEKINSVVDAGTKVRVVVCASEDDVVLPEEKDGYVIFGHYEQDGKTDNGKEEIRWIVIDTDGDYKLLLSEYAIYGAVYSTSKRDVKWETSSIRRWLNDKFYNEAFNWVEQKQIRLSNITNPDSYIHYSTDGSKGAPGGNDTEDYIFLLSLDEVTSDYFLEKGTKYGENNGRACQITNYAKNFVSEYYDCKTSWWLRSPGGNNKRFSCVSRYGGIFSNWPDDNLGIRPAMWVKMVK